MVIRKPITQCQVRTSQPDDPSEGFVDQFWKSILLPQIHHSLTREISFSNSSIDARLHFVDLPVDAWALSDQLSCACRAGRSRPCPAPGSGRRS